jgi:hypothetical protein
MIAPATAIGIHPHLNRLQKEAARVQREIVGYAALIQNARRSMGTISEILSSWRHDRDDIPRISA